MRISALKGKKVITVPGGGIVGTVDDVLFHSIEQRLGALVIKSDRFSSLQIVSAKDVGTIGGDVVTISSADNLKDRTRFNESQQLVSASEAVGRQVATVSGNYVGKLADVHINPTTCKIIGFEVTGGLFARVFGRTHTIDVSEHTRLGKDLLIVDDMVITTVSEELMPDAAVAAK